MATVFKRNGRGPWIVHYFDAEGRRRERSTRTTDKRVADRIASQLTAGVALRREGIIDPRMDRYSAENMKPVQRHVADYIRHLEHGRRSPLTIRDARAHLDWIVATAGVTRLSDLTLDAVERALATLQARGLSARSVNHRGGSVRAFLAWCVKSGRTEANALRFLPHQVEATDRRRERRALSDEELARLFEVAGERGRKAWYMLAALAGLRLSELRKLTWGAVDLARGVLVIDMGKAKRIDELPLHPELASELANIRPPHVLPSARVFPTAVTNDTRTKDFRRANIALVDADGRVADLHSLRATLGTRLARQGVAPQVAQRIMRHSDYRTTIKHYTRLELSDTAAAVRALPTIASPQQSPQQSQHELRRSVAT
jgi:integrase